MFDSGQCRCVENTGRLVVVYDLMSFRTLVFAALLAVAFGVASQFGNLAAGLVIGGCAFACLYGLNIWSASERVPGFLQRASRSSDGRPIPDTAALLIDA